MQDFFRVVDLDGALELRERFARVETETCDINKIQGRVGAEQLVAGEDIPPCPRATMDGYALAAASTFGASESNPALLQVIGSVEMGLPVDLRVGQGQAVAVPTGGMMPAGCDAVAMIEHCELLGAGALEVSRSVAPGQHVIDRGEDCQQGQIVIPRGAMLDAPHVGMLAALGQSSFPVYRQPRVAILSTGDELVAIDQVPQPGQIRDVNSHTLAALLRSCRAIPLQHGIFKDDFSVLQQALRAALAVGDMVLLSGGSSVGARDFTLAALRDMPGAEVLFHGVAMKPGKPTILAQVGGKALWGLPGHITSAMLVFHALVRPFLLYISGLSCVERRLTVTARLTQRVASAPGRQEFVRVKLSRSVGEFSAEPLLGKSGLLHTMLHADGCVVIGRDSEGLERGELVQVEPFGQDGHYHG